MPLKPASTQCLLDSSHTFEKEGVNKNVKYSCFLPADLITRECGIGAKLNKIVAFGRSPIRCSGIEIAENVSVSDNDVRLAERSTKLLLPYRPLVARRQIVDKAADTAGGGTDGRAFLAARQRANRGTTCRAAADD